MYSQKSLACWRDEVTRVWSCIRPKSVELCLLRPRVNCQVKLKCLLLCIVITFYGSSKLVTVERWTTYWLPAVCRAGWLPPTSFLTCMLAYLTYSTVIRTITHDHAGHFFYVCISTYCSLMKRFRRWRYGRGRQLLWLTFVDAVRPLLFVWRRQSVAVSPLLSVGRCQSSPSVRRRQLPLAAEWRVLTSWRPLTLAYRRSPPSSDRRPSLTETAAVAAWDRLLAAAACQAPLRFKYRYIVPYWHFVPDSIVSPLLPYKFVC